MTFQQLRYLVEISRCGSINKAARNLFLSQSGISTAVRELEEELGVSFFQRSNRGVEFTPEGKEFLSYALSLLEQKQRIESLYTGSRNAAAPVRFSVVSQRYPFTEDAFLRLLRLTDEDSFHYSIKETGMDKVVDYVYERRGDIGVLFLSELTDRIIRRLLDSRGLEFREMAAVQPCVFVRRGHPLAGRCQVSEEAFSGYPYLSFEQNQGVAVDLSEEYQPLSFKKPARSIVVSNRTTAMNVLAETDAFTTGSGLLVEGVSDERIISIPLAGAAKIHLGWIKRKSAALTPEMARFVHLLEQSLQDSIRYTELVHRRLPGGE